MFTLGNNLSSRLTIIFGWCVNLWSYEVLQLLNRSYKQGPILYYIFNTLLISLFVLHIYWWVLIFRMIVKQVEARGRISDDVRSDSDDDDDEGTGKEDWYQQNLQVNAAFSAMAFTHTISQDYSLPVQEVDGASLVGPNILSRPEAQFNPIFCPLHFSSKSDFSELFCIGKGKMLVCWACCVHSDLYSKVRHAAVKWYREGIIHFSLSIVRICTAESSTLL